MLYNMIRSEFPVLSFLLFFLKSTKIVGLVDVEKILQIQNLKRL